MNITLKFQKKIKSFFFLLIFLFVLIFQTNFQIIMAIPMDTYQNEFVIEELRLKIPLDFKEAWLEAEGNIWEPWLSKQEGYLGRQIFWNKEKEEALILVNWRNKKLWKSISIKEVNEIQERFEENVKKSLKVNVSPFQIIYEGELYKQG